MCGRGLGEGIFRPARSGLTEMSHRVVGVPMVFEFYIISEHEDVDTAKNLPQCSIQETVSAASKQAGSFVGSMIVLPPTETLL